jgi:4-hydroxybenzoate polyprenyltransferase
MVTKRIASLVGLSRPYNTISGALLFLIGFFLTPGRHILTIDCFVALMVICLGFTYATIQNDLIDVEIDAINSPEKSLVNGAIKAKEASLLAQLLLVLMLALSLYHAPRHILQVMSMLVLIWSYNMPPLLFSRKPIASIIILSLLYAVFPLVYGFLISDSARFPTVYIVLIVFWFLIRISVAVLKDFKDEVGDKKYGKRTFFLTYGYAKTIWLSTVSYLLGGIGILGILTHYRQVGWLMFLPLVLFLYTIWLRVGLWKATDSKELARRFHQIFFAQHQSDLTFLLCLLLLK